MISAARRRVRRTGCWGVAAAAMFFAACSGGGETSGDAVDATTAPNALSTSTTGPCDDAASMELDVPYASHAETDPLLTSVDVYSPQRSNCDLLPVVVWVHGGGWISGDKTNRVDDKIALFGDAGYVFVSVNYRLTDTDEEDPLRYPAHNEDVAQSLAWLVENIEDYGGDPEQVAVLGHSAGAGIVAAVAIDARHLGASGLGLDALDCVAALDTEAFDVPRVMQGGPRVVGTYTPVFGTDPDVWTEASPITYVTAGSDIPPFLLARRGSPDRRSMVDDFTDTLAGASVEVTVIDAVGLAHEDVNVLIGAPGDTVMTPPLMKFLEDCFSPGDG